MQASAFEVPEVQRIHVYCQFTQPNLSLPDHQIKKCTCKGRVIKVHHNNAKVAATLNGSIKCIKSLCRYKYHVSRQQTANTQRSIVCQAPHLQQLFGQVDGNDASRAAHTSQIVRYNIGAHLKMVDDHCRQRGSGVEQTAVDHQNVNLQSKRVH